MWTGVSDTLWSLTDIVRVIEDWEVRLAAAKISGTTVVGSIFGPNSRRKKIGLLGTAEKDDFQTNAGAAKEAEIDGVIGGVPARSASRRKFAEQDFGWLSPHARSMSEMPFYALPSRK